MSFSFRECILSVAQCATAKFRVRTRVSVCMCGHVAEVLQLLIWRSIAFIISSLNQSICPSSVSVFKSAIFSLVRLSMLINHLLSDKTVADAFSRHLFVRGFPVRVIWFIIHVYVKLLNTSLINGLPRRCFILSCACLSAFVWYGYTNCFCIMCLYLERCWNLQNLSDCLVLVMMLFPSQQMY